MWKHKLKLCNETEALQSKTNSKTKKAKKRNYYLNKKAAVEHTKYLLERENSPFLDYFLKSKKKIDAEFGMQFVESVSKEGSYTACSFNEYPLIVWKKYGLGMTAAITFSPTQVGFTNNTDEGFRLAWSYFVRHSSKPV
ncbi:MAG: hypothetical protein HRS57_03065, partial [Mycoplasmataceae bacterium]|nr:hypothetical protein [Mycoplasmataceae bacterium]